MTTPLRLIKDVGKAYLDKASVPYRDRFEMVRLGFTGEAYLLFDLADNDPDDFVPNAAWGPLLRTNSHATQELLGNKLLFWHTYASELPIPPVLAISAGGRLVPVADKGVRSTEALLERLGDETVIIKPLDGQKGKRVHSLSVKGGVPHLDAEPASREQVDSVLYERDGNIVVGFARQAAYASQVFPGSTNTVRVVMFGGAGTGYEPFVSALAHRFGTAASAPVDNQSSGGLMGRIDPVSHRLGKVCMYPFGAPRLYWHDVHPDTGAAIAGVEVPGLGPALERLDAFMRAHPYITYVGWDVVLQPGTGDGFTVLEANCGAAIQTQMFGFPYRRDDRVLAFFEHHALSVYLKDAHRRRRDVPATKPGRVRATA